MVALLFRRLLRSVKEVRIVRRVSEEREFRRWFRKKERKRRWLVATGLKRKKYR